MKNSTMELLPSVPLISSFEFRVPDFGFLVSGSGFRVPGSAWNPFQALS